MKLCGLFLIVVARAAVAASGEQYVDSVTDANDISLLQAGLDLQQAAKALEAPTTTLTETLVTELAYLAGGVGSFEVSLTDTMGWTAGTTVSDTNNITGFIDTMQIYTSESVCAVVFSATDDDEDGAQQMLGAAQPVEFCGLAGVNGGYAQEMQQYMEQQESWTQAFQELGLCAASGKTLYAAGHSMGGAMASLFAFCVNTNANYSYKFAFGGGQLPEVNLVTIGAPGPSTTPLYNGDPGNCFSGTRRYVYVPPNAASQQFHVDNLNNFAQLAKEMGDTASGDQLRGAAATLESLAYPSAQATGLIQGASSSIGSLWLVVSQLMVNATIPGYEALLPLYPKFQQSFGGMLQKHALSSLVYDYDPVPQLFDFAGYKHPLMKVEPQSHAVKGGFSIAATECAEGSSVPNEDYPQLFWGLLMANANRGGISFPNHGMCCIISDSDCMNRFSGTAGLHCTDMKFR